MNNEVITTGTPILIRYNENLNNDKQIIPWEDNCTKKKIAQKMEKFTHEIFTVEADIIVGYDLQKFDKSTQTAYDLIRVSILRYFWRSCMYIH